jgi:hypothetical protein
VIDEDRVKELQARKPRAVQAVTQVSGRLHMVDVDPYRVGIRTSTGFDWLCRFPEELEDRILGLIKRNVTASGAGVRTSAARGEFEIHAIEPLEEYEQTELFSLERRPLDELLAGHGIEPQGWDFFADPDWEDDESSARYLAAVLEPEPQP